MIKEVEKLKEKIDSIPDKKVERYKPEYPERYFYLDSCGHIQDILCKSSVADYFRYNTGNCFKTEEEARDYRENLLTKQQLKDIALELNNGVEINWDNDGQLKHFLTISYATEQLTIDWVWTAQDCNVYCLSDKFLKVAKERIGEEKLIKLIKSGV